MTKRERQLVDRLALIYRHLYPMKHGRGMQAWFRRELSNGGVDVGPTTVHKWLTNGAPVDRIAVIDDVVSALEADVVADLTTRLQEVTG